MTDKLLFRLCKKYGARVLVARRKFAGLLPEVARRRLCEKRGFCSIYEFAARLGGLTRDQVDEVLRLERRFGEMPVLQQALLEGDVSAGKLARVAAVATAENSARVLEMARQLSYAALDIKVKEIKMENGLMEPIIEGKSLCAQTNASRNLARLSAGEATTATLAELGVGEVVAKKLIELKSKGLDVNAILQEFLQKREMEIAAEENQIQSEMVHQAELREFYEDRLIADEGVSSGLPPRTRYIPRKVARLIYKKFGEKCAVEGCARRAGQWHHLQHYSAGGPQTPQNLQPLCLGHHQLLHPQFSSTQSSVSTLFAEKPLPAV